MPPHSQGETFECFAEGSILAFEEFGGIAECYRLDNLSPAIKKIFKRERLLTRRFKEFQDYYGFKVHFCNVSSGWEKGTVESNNFHIKRRLRNSIAYNKLSFTSLDAFKSYVHQKCLEFNRKKDVELKFSSEVLLKLPPSRFEAFQPYISKVNKYSTVTYGNQKHRYSVPSEYIRCRVEVRAYASEVIIAWQGEIIAKHKRLYGTGDEVSIHIEHIIKELARKPGVFKEWKHRNIIFEQPVWYSFYRTMLEQPGAHDNKFLKCLELISDHGKDEITTAMERLKASGGLLTNAKLKEVITDAGNSQTKMKPSHRNLVEYDKLLQGKNNG